MNDDWLWSQNILFWSSFFSISYFLCNCIVDHLLAFFFWLLYCLSFFDLRFLITHWLAMVLSVLFRFTLSDYPLVGYGILCPVSDYPLVSSDFSYWVRFAQTLAFYVMSCGQMFSVLLFSFWPFYCLPSFNLRLLITPLVSLIQRKRKSDDINKKTFLTYRSFSSFKKTLLFSNVLTRSFNWSHSIPNLKS